MQPNLPPAPPKGSEPQPFFEHLQHEMERLIDRFRGYPTVADLSLGSGLHFAIDMAESDDVIEVTAEIPGAHADDLDVSLHGDVLVIRGDKSDERSKGDKNYHMVERSFGSFQRQVPLGFTPKDDAIEGRFSDGVLRLSIAKPAEAKTARRKIDINNS